MLFFHYTKIFRKPGEYIKPKKTCFLIFDFFNPPFKCCSTSNTKFKIINHLIFYFFIKYEFVQLKSIFILNSPIIKIIEFSFW